MGIRQSWPKLDNQPIKFKHRYRKFPSDYQNFRARGDATNSAFLHFIKILFNILWFSVVMGVVIVQPYPVPEGKSGSHAVEALQKRLEALGAIKSGNFCVDCETYATAPNMTPPKAAHIIRNTEQPATCFAMMDSGACLVADVLFETLMNKLSGIYTAKKASKIESKGQRYEVEDFLVKIGSVSIGPSFKGILVEVEYQPCVIPANCFDLLKEFMQGFLGNILQAPPNYMQSKMAQIYTPTDTVHQYMEHFNNFRKQTVAGR